jgi:hypothetical protein
MWAFDIKREELDKSPVQGDMSMGQIHRRYAVAAFWKRPVELDAVGSATANSPRLSLQFMRHSETVERDVQRLYPEKLSEQCTTTRLGSTGKPGGCSWHLQESGFFRMRSLVQHSAR